MHAFMEREIPAGHVGIHWFGQNSYAFKDSHGKVILVDPFFPHERPAEKYVYPDPPVREADLKTDAVLLTHAHLDHTNSETIKRIHDAWPETCYIGPRECIDKISKEAGVPPDTAAIVLPGDTTSFDGFELHVVWGKPAGGDPRAGIKAPDTTHVGYIIEMEGVRLYISGDIINTFADHDELIRPIAAREPHIGFLTTHPTEGEFPFFDGSIAMACAIGLKTAVPAHYDCFARRTYDPAAWAALLPPEGPKPLIIPYNTHVLYPAMEG